MINLKDVGYRVVCITPEGKKLDITSLTTNLGWEEGTKELSVRISLKVNNTLYQGKRISQFVQPGTPIFVYATIGSEQKEVTRGTVEKWSPTYTNGSSVLDIEAYDEMHPLRKNEDYAYFVDGVTTKAMITQILDKWGVPYDYKGPDITHNKMVFKKSCLSDMLQKIFDDVKQKGSGAYFARANDGKVEIVARGANDDVYHFDESDNTVSAKDSFDSGSLVTRVVVIGKTDEEGHQAVEASVEGKTEFGIRQMIVERQHSKSLEQATEAANQLLRERGALKRKTTILAPDVPLLRKGDRIRVRAGTVLGYFFVKSIRHNAEDQKMTIEVDEDKETNKTLRVDNGLGTMETDSNDVDESTGDEVD